VTQWLVCGTGNALDGVAERGRLSQYDGRPLSDDDTARLRERLLYLEQLKSFAERIGYPRAKKLRKDELERAIMAFLRTVRLYCPRSVHCARRA